MPTIKDARYVHTNLIAHDWRRLADFYERLFGCVPVPPHRDLSGEWLERGTGIADARLQGIHLRLPGHGPHGPTLEIFTYARTQAQELPVANRSGYGHLAFAVEDVGDAVAAVLEAGGTTVGESVSTTIEGRGQIQFAYVRDPEGNIIELQRWFE
jgi:glyoxylase I family protein